MAIVVPAGTLNLNATQAPNVIVQIFPPAQATINGVPTNIVGVVGTATWGPINSPVVIGSMSEQIQNFGSPQNAEHDLGTAIDAMTLNFANNFMCVRVTDGTDLKATDDVLDISSAIGMTLTAKYSGTTGNQIKAVVTTGSAANTYRITVGLPGSVPETFDNIGGTGATFWQNAVNAINNGNQSTFGQPSNLVTATVGAATGAPALVTYALAGGTNGGVPTTANFIGVDTSPRTGMYALRGTKASLMFIADMYDTTSYAAQESFAISEGMYVILTGPAGQTIQQAAAALIASGVANYQCKFMVGDWVYFQDAYNNVLRLISPQAWVAGRLANLAPSESGLNKPIVGIVGTQTSFANKRYTTADIQYLAENQLDVIANPSPGGNYFSEQTGQNTSPISREGDDSFTRLTLYIGYSIAAGVGFYIGDLQTPSVRLSAQNTLQAFLSNLQQLGWIGDVNGGPAFKVTLDASNNPSNRVAQGYMQADVQVVYFSVIRVFLINLQTGVVTLQSVTNA